MARTRVYHNGTVEHDDLPVAKAQELIGTDNMTVWIDLGPDEAAELATLVPRLGLHDVAVREALAERPRANYLHYPDHDFLSVRALRFETGSGTVADSRITAFVTTEAMVTLRTDDHFPLDAMVGHWDDLTELATEGTGFLLHGLLKEVVASQYTAARALDEALDDLEDALFDGHPDDRYLERRSHQLRMSVVALRRLTLPTPDILDELCAGTDHLINDALTPYFTGIRKHADRVVEWAESLRETVAAILQTRMALHDSRMGVISKRVTGWAALIAIPAVVTGFYGINVPFPGVDRWWGFVACCALMIVLFAALYALFRRKDWL